nr:rod shape-determining protein RodA [Paludibacteraceae bacterium]
VLNIWVEVPFVYVALGVLAATIVYLLVRAFLLRSKSYMWVAVFIMAAIVYTYSAEYLFKKVLQDHQRNRIEVVLGIKDDPSGAGYNINQAKIAIGSGGFLGKGFLKGTQTKLKYVPEQDTDFIFCTVGEEFGFWGSVLLIGLYVWLLLRLIFLAERQNDTFARIYGYCVVSIFFAHVMINIGMVLGLVPVIGIPLPFMSYGGSSLCAFTVLLFIFLKLDIARLGRAT